MKLVKEEIGADSWKEYGVRSKMAHNTMSADLLDKFKGDLKQNEYNLKQRDLLTPFIKEGIDNLLSALEDYDN